jgi:two-component system NtrC family sensor kinase
MDLALQPAFIAEASTLLILLAGAILIYWSFRERYLVPWIAGFSVYGLAKFFSALSRAHHPGAPWHTLAYLAFILAVGLFTGTVFLYVYRTQLLWPAGAILVFALGLGLAYSIAPKVVLLRGGFEITWRLVLVLASAEMVRFTWGRPNFGRWVLAATLLFLHSDLPTSQHAVYGYDILIDLLLGISMMTIVLDDSRVQIQRLDVVNTMALQISSSQQFLPTLETVLRDFARITRAKSAWFRLLDGTQLVLIAQTGLSPEMVETILTVDVARSVGGYALRERKVVVLPLSEASPEFQQALEAEGLHHLVIVPVEGKDSQIGMLVVGMPRFRVHTENEKSFLKAAAKQLGLAAENRNLMEQIVRSRNEWASTFSSIADYILVHDAQYRIVRANQALLARLGLTGDQVSGQECESVLPGGGRAWRRCPYCSAGDWLGQEDPCLGGYSMVSTSAYTGENPARPGTVHVIKDLTKTRATEERYAALFNHMQEGVFVSTPEGKVVDCNDAFVKMLGYASKEELLNLDLVESLYVDAQQRERFLGEMAKRGHVRNFEYLLRRKDGHLINVIESSVATREPGSRIERYQGIVLDVTDMKRAEEEIRRRNRELYVLNNIAVTFNQSFDLQEILQLMLLQIVELLSTDTASVYLFEEESSFLRRQVSYGHRTSFFNESDGVPLPPDFVEKIKAEHAEIIDQQDLPQLPEILKKIVELEGMRSWVWVMLWRKEKVLGVLATASRADRKFTTSEESILIAVGRQLATTVEKIQLYHETRKAYEDLRRTQEQLLQSEKMSAVGQLISGVAHELNNPLTAILGYTQLLETEELEPRVRDFIGKLHKQAQRTQKIVQNLLSFARQQKPRRLHVDLRTVMEDTIALRDYDLKANNIMLQRDFDAALPAVVADPHQIEQVYLNIINNAVDAMLESGHGGSLNIRIYGENGHVVSEFLDSGPGISDPKHAFDPFFTTKGVGKGTGLGLSICYGIVKEHGGEISAENVASGGARIKVRLPVAVGEKPVTESDRIVARRELQLEGRVLLVDDEESIIDFEREVLTAAGLEVIAATSGNHAIEFLQNEEFDAIFLDSKIGGERSSEDLYRWIAQSRPSLLGHTVLVLSDVSDLAVRAFVDKTKVMCLVKPFEVSELLAAARRVLRRARAAHR